MPGSQIIAAEHAEAVIKPLPTLWRNKQYILLLIAYTLSLFGNSFHSIALTLWVLNETGSAKMMTVILVTNLIVSSLLGSVAGTFADRMNRRRMMLTSDVLRCLFVLSIALCITLPKLPFIVILFLTAIVTAIGLFQSPAFQASLTNIVGKEHIQRATGLLNISDNISRTAGFALGGIFVAAFGGAWAIMFDGLTFLISFLLVLLAGSFPSPSRKPQDRKNFKDDLMTGFRYIGKDPFAKSVTVLLPSLFLFFMPSLMLTQVMAVQVWKATPFHFGLIEACIPLGYMLGAGIIVALGSKIKRRGKLIMFNLLLMGPLYILLSYSRTALAAIPVILLVGFMFSFCTLLINIILRLEVSQELQGRVFGTLGSLISVVPSAGLVIASYYADLYGSDTVMFIIGCMLLLFGAAAFTRLKNIREYR